MPTTTRSPKDCGSRGSVETIHHGEVETSRVVHAQVRGRHVVRWTVHAANMRQAQSGEFVVDHANDVLGQPIASLDELAAYLEEMDSDNND